MTAVSHAEPELTTDHRMWRRRVLLSTYVAYIGFYLCRKVFSICKTSLSREFGVGLDAIAHIWTAYLVAYMVGMLVNSFLGRRVGARVLLVGGLGLSILINVVFGFANSYPTFLVFMVFNGLAQAAGWPGCVGSVQEWLRKRERGTIMGFWSTNYLLGNMLYKSLGGYLLGHYGWRWSFFGCTLLAFGIWWLVLLWQRNRPADVGLSPIIADEPADRAVEASCDERIGFRAYSRLFLNPIVPLMGLSYFCVKFMRYALDSWLPTFLNLGGMSAETAAYYSQVFDIAGLGGVVLAGWALDRVFRGNWPGLCALMGVGVVVGYLAVGRFGVSPAAIALLYGVVGFMLYGPDTLLGGAAAVQVAGERNGIAVAGLVNGIGSLGPIVQEEVIGYLMRGGSDAANIRGAHLLTLGVSAVFVCFMLTVLVVWRRKLGGGRS